MRKRLSFFVMALVVLAIILESVAILPAEYVEAASLKKPTITVSESNGNPKIVINQVGGATGYRIYRKTASDKKWVTVTTTKNTSFVDEKWSSAVGSKIQYKVKAYVTESGKKVWSKASSVKKWTVPAKDDQTLKLKDFLNDRNVLDIKRSTLIDTKTFIKGLKLDKDALSLSLSKELIVKNTDVLLLAFTASAENKSAKVKVKVNDTALVWEYAIGVEASDYILPIKNLTSVKKIEFVFSNGTITIGNFELANIGQNDGSKIKAGVYALDEKSKTINVDDGVGYTAEDSLYDGKYVYAVKSGTLIVYSIDDPKNPSVISRLAGLGNTREMALANSGKTLAISSRENGVFLVDISDVNKMSVISNIETLGLATGIFVEKDYCFICSRKHGVEIYDISDPKNPEFVSQCFYGAEEFYDCTVENGFLYISSWAGRKAFVYDLKDLSNPVLASTINLDGQAGAITAVNGVLYVATGYNSPGNSKKMLDPNYGVGNGFEAYDVSNPYKPVWLSTSKIDGRYYYVGFDHWRIVVSNDTAYVANAYSGVFVYDVKISAIF